MLPSLFIFCPLMRIRLWKGGMLMKNKHCTYAKEILLCSVRDFRFISDFRNKSTIKANNRPRPDGCLN